MLVLKNKEEGTLNAELVDDFMNINNEFYKIAKIASNVEYVFDEHTEYFGDSIKI